MQLIQREISVPTPRAEVKIVGASCLHYGAAGCDEELVDFWRNRILTSPNTYCILLGDLVDAISEKDKRYDEQEVADWCKNKKWGSTLIDRQYAYFLDKWKPLAEAGKILWLHAGNHEQKLRSTHNTDLAARWAGEMRVPYAGLAALSNLFVNAPGTIGKRGRKYRVSFFTQHGGGGAQSTGAIINKADAMLSHYDVDVALMGHLHRKMHVTSRTLGISESGKRKVRDRVAAVCGTFLDGQKEGVVGYGELKGYRPAALGPVVVHLKYEGVTNDKDDERATGYLRIWLSDCIRDDTA